MSVDQNFPVLDEVAGEEEELMGEPSFELRLRDGEPQVSGCYFMYPTLQVVEASWDGDRPDRILATASDGSRWYADGVRRTGVANVVLRAAGDAGPSPAGEPG